MRTFILFCLLALGTNMAFAQDCQKVCDKKNQYVQNGDVVEAILYHDNGTIAQTGLYTAGNKLHGEWVSYDTKGNKTAIAQYDNGAKVGTWTFYEGNIKRVVTYENSKIASVNTWEMKDSRVVVNK